MIIRKHCEKEEFSGKGNNVRETNKYIWWNSANLKIHLSLAASSSSWSSLACAKDRKWIIDYALTSRHWFWISFNTFCKSLVKSGFSTHLLLDINGSWGTWLLYPTHVTLQGLFTPIYHLSKYLTIESLILLQRRLLSFFRFSTPDHCVAWRRLLRQRKPWHLSTPNLPLSRFAKLKICQTFPPWGSQLVREVNSATVNVSSFEPAQFWLPCSHLESSYLPNASLADMVSVSMLRINGAIKYRESWF